MAFMPLPQLCDFNLSTLRNPKAQVAMADGKRRTNGTLDQRTNLSRQAGDCQWPNGTADTSNARQLWMHRGRVHVAQTHNVAFPGFSEATSLPSTCRRVTCHLSSPSRLNPEPISELAPEGIKKKILFEEADCELFKA